MTEPGALLMDEATVGLDPGSRKLLLDYVLDLCEQRGLGILWATHLVDEAERASQVLVLHRGCLICRGTPRDLVEGTGQKTLADAFLNLTGKSTTSQPDGQK